MKHLKFVENSLLHYHLCYNKNEEMLGKIFIHPKWKRYVWEQNKGIIMSRGCLKELLAFMETLGGKE